MYRLSLELDQATDPGLMERAKKKKGDQLQYGGDHGMLTRARTSSDDDLMLGLGKRSTSMPDDTTISYPDDMESASVSSESTLLALSMADRDERNECLAPEERAVPRDQTELIKCGENRTEHRVRDVSVKPREQATRAEPVEPPQWSSKEPSMMETMMRI